MMPPPCLACGCTALGGKREQPAASNLQTNCILCGHKHAENPAGGRGDHDQLTMEAIPPVLAHVRDRHKRGTRRFATLVERQFALVVANAFQRQIAAELQHQQQRERRKLTPRVADLKARAGAFLAELEAREPQWRGGREPLVAFEPILYPIGMGIGIGIGTDSKRGNGKTADVVDDVNDDVSGGGGGGGGASGDAASGDDASGAAAAAVRAVLVPHANSYKRLVLYALATRFGLKWETVSTHERWGERELGCGCCYDKVLVVSKDLLFFAPVDPAEAVETLRMPLFSLQDFWDARTDKLKLDGHAGLDFVGGSLLLHSATDRASRAQSLLHRLSLPPSPSADAPEGDIVALSSLAGAPPTAPWSGLPRDILASIFTLLPLRTILLSCSRVCRAWRTASQHDAVWHRVSDIVALSQEDERRSHDVVAVTEELGYSSVRQWLLDSLANANNESLDTHRRRRGEFYLPRKQQRRMRRQLLLETLAEAGIPAWRARYVDDSDYIKFGNISGYGWQPSMTLFEARDSIAAKTAADSTPQGEFSIARTSSPRSQQETKETVSVLVLPRWIAVSDAVRCEVPRGTNATAMAKLFRSLLGLEDVPDSATVAGAPEPLRSSDELSDNALVTLEFAVRGNSQRSYDISRLPYPSDHEAQKCLEDDSVIWRNSDHASVDTFPWYETGLQQDTFVRVVCDVDALHLLFVAEDVHSSALERSLHGTVCEDSCVEFFACPFSDSPAYFNLELNCCGAIHLGFGEGREGRTLASPEVVARIDVRTSLEGSSKKEADDDSSWRLYARLPRDALTTLCGGREVQFDGAWRGNFFRCGGVTDPQFACWQPHTTRNPDYHQTAQFGVLLFEH